MGWLTWKGKFHGAPALDKKLQATKEAESRRKVTGEEPQLLNAKWSNSIGYIYVFRNISTIKEK